MRWEPPCFLVQPRGSLCAASSEGDTVVACVHWSKRNGGPLPSFAQKFFMRAAVCALDRLLDNACRRLQYESDWERW
jgi:hypothetical protein